MSEKVVNQLYVATKGYGPVHQGQHVAAFTDGTAHIVLANISETDQTFKIKIGTQIHMYEYLKFIEPICLNETGLINTLPCPQCGNQSLMMHNLTGETHPMKSIECGNCPVSVSDPNRDINELITIWNNIPRWENL